MELDSSAIDRLRELLAEENDPEVKLRVFVQGGGCSGMQYGFTFDKDHNDDDFVQDYGDGVSVLIDSMSMTYLQGARIRWNEDVYGSSFVIDNPNAQTTCGCGSSFNPY